MENKFRYSNLTWDNILDRSLWVSKLDKKDFLNLIKLFSYDVPPLSDRLDILDYIINSFSDIENGDKEILNRYQYIVGIIVSTMNLNEFNVGSYKISEIINLIYKFVIENNLASKFIDFILANDWGKALILFKINSLGFKNVLSSNYYKKSDEFSSLILKISSSEDGRKLFELISYRMKMDRFLSLSYEVMGKTGGLLRQIFFATRRELDYVDDEKDDISDLIYFIQFKNMNDINAYSLIMLSRKVFNFSMIDIVNEFILIKPELAKMLMTSFDKPYLIWSKIQLSLYVNNNIKYNNACLNRISLYDFYDDLLNFNCKLSSKNFSKKIGVIITTYNPDLKLLELSIKSIIKQSYDNISVCVVDDNSLSEKSEEIEHLITKISDRRILYIKNQNNIGQYISRNIAMQNMTDCEYFAIQDDDDISHPERLETQFLHLENSKEGVLAMCQQVRFTNSLRYVSDKLDPFEFDFGPASSLFKANVVKELGGFANVRSRGDVEFITRIKRNFSDDAIINIPLPMYIMRCEINTVSASKDRFLKTQLDVFRMIMSKENTSEYQNGQQHALFI